MDTYSLMRALLFRLKAETSHDLALWILSQASNWQVTSQALAKLSGAQQVACPVRCMGIDFPNPVGLAAGLDKSAAAANALAALGFGWVELGTVTPKPQPGNPKPRMFRLQEYQAIINRMGFNSEGLEVFLENLAKVRPNIIKGVNIGKNASTPIDEAAADYVRGLSASYADADYIAVNISSPNTKNLRQLQSREGLDHILTPLLAARERLREQHGKQVPLLVKIAPDLQDQEIVDIAAALLQFRVDGVIATNTTVSRKSVANHARAAEVGGLSGRPLRDITSDVIAKLYAELGTEMPIIGVGGIASADDAVSKINAGATLLQVYSGLIYGGPRVPGDIVKGLQGQLRDNEDYATFVARRHGRIKAQ